MYEQSKNTAYLYAVGDINGVARFRLAKQCGDYAEVKDGVRWFHNATHPERMLDYIDAIGSHHSLSQEQRRTLGMAIWWHHIEPGGSPRERVIKSAEAFRRATIDVQSRYGAASLPDREIETVKGLILATSSEVKDGRIVQSAPEGNFVQYKLPQLLCDLELFGMSTPDGAADAMLRFTEQSVLSGDLHLGERPPTTIRQLLGSKALDTVAKDKVLEFLQIEATLYRNQEYYSKSSIFLTNERHRLANAAFLAHHAEQLEKDKVTPTEILTQALRISTYYNTILGTYVVKNSDFF